MTNQPPKRVSVRELARRIGVTHGALSSAAHDGRLSEGVAFDARGRLVITDPDAAARNWRDVSTRLAINMVERRPRPAPIDDIEAMRREVMLARRVIESLLIVHLAANVDDRDAAIEWLRAEMADALALRVDGDTAAHLRYLDTGIRIAEGCFRDTEPEQTSSAKPARLTASKLRDPGGST